MKREIAKYVSECDTCRRVKASHLRSAGPLQPLSIPSWKQQNVLGPQTAVVVDENEAGNRPICV